MTFAAIRCALPAGHILGSAMLRVARQSDGATLLYTGDYKLRQGLTAQRAELLPADTLIMETTFGLPQFCFPPIEQTLAAMRKWVRETTGRKGHPRPARLLLGQGPGNPRRVAGGGCPDHAAQLHHATDAAMRAAHAERAAVSRR